MKLMPYERWMATAVARRQAEVRSDRVQRIEANYGSDGVALLERGTLLAVIDLAEPVALIFGLVLNLLSAQQAREVIAGYSGLVAPGSFVVISCGRCDDKELWDELSSAYTAAPACNHAPGEVEGFLAGLELVPPGLVATQNWRGGWHDAPTAPPGPVYVLAGVARKTCR